jgi:hypothetical protein
MESGLGHAFYNACRWCHPLRGVMHVWQGAKPSESFVNRSVLASKEQLR